MKRFFASVILFLVFFAASSAFTFGSDCTETTKIFSSTYNVSFSFSDSGQARVVQNVKLKNLVGDCYASNYILKINSAKIKSVSGRDSLGSLAIKTTKAKNTTTLTAKLNNEVIGKNKSVSFQLRYTIDDLATEDGFIWNLVIPKIITGETVNSYNLKIVTPAEFGKVFSVSPAPARTSEGKTSNVLIFGKEALKAQSIYASFGDFQEIKFNFKIPLENKSFLSRKFSVPLPPDTDKQRVLLTRLEPRPQEIKVDQSGNYLATYEIGAKTLSQVVLEGAVKIIGDGRRFTPPKAFSGNDLDKFKEASDFIPVQDSQIQQKATELKTAEEIYSFVINYLKYDKNSQSSSYKRKGADKLLNSDREAGVEDFVDLFTAICRAAGIPTRQVIGFTTSQNDPFKPTYLSSFTSDRLHVWAQYYDSKDAVWVSVDPTWSNTQGVEYFKESLPDRFVLLFNYDPDLVESLKTMSSSPENMSIYFEKEHEDFSARTDLSLIVEQAVSGFPATLSVRIRNNSGVSLTAGSLNVESESIGLIGSRNIEIPIIFPFEEKLINFKIRSNNLLGGDSGKVKATFTAKNGEEDLLIEKESKAEIQSFFSFGTQQILLIIVILLLLVGIIAPKIYGRKR